MLAVTTDSFRGYGLDYAFETAKKAGFDGIEVVIRHGEYDTYNAEYLKQLSKRHDLKIVALSTPKNMSATKATRVVDLAVEIGVPLVNLTPPDIFNFNYKKWIKEEVRSLRKRKKVTIALANPPFKTVLGILPKYAFNDVYQLREFDDLAFDVSNTVGRSEPLLEIYSILKKNIRCVHLSNAKNEKMHTLLADGNIPLESFLTRLARDKFEGPIILKLSPEALGIGKMDKVMNNFSACKKFIDKYFKN